MDDFDNYLAGLADDGARVRIRVDSGPVMVVGEVQGKARDYIAVLPDGPRPRAFIIPVAKILWIQEIR